MRGWRWLFRRDRAEERQSTPLEARDELLSAYLDDELTPAERAEADAALAGDAGLRVQLDGLREVRTALRSLDEVRAPRSFALTAPPGPAVARTWGMPRLELATRLATMAAAVLFVVALVVPGGGSSETVTGAPGVASFSAAAPATTGALEAASPQGAASSAAAAPQAATPAGRALAAPRALTPSDGAGTAASAETPAAAPMLAPAPAGADQSPAATPTAKAAAAAAPQAPTVLASPPGVASPAAPEGGSHRLITVGLGALTVLLMALSAGEWIVRRGRAA